MGEGDGYELLDSGNQQKLERFGDYTLVRPSAAAVWAPHDLALWQRVDATFHRSSRGTGRWEEHRSLPRTWSMSYAGLRWQIRPNEHGNVGIFAEQSASWGFIREQASMRPGLEVINLFGYTGGSTLAAAQAGAKVCHVDASKTSVQAARDNAELSGLAEAPVRWITDDAVKFVEREVRRGRRYHGIILDPPTYGRGTQREVWQIESDLPVLLKVLRRLLASDAQFFLLTSHSPGFTPLALSNLIEPPADSIVASGEMVCLDRQQRPLPSGAFAQWSRSPR